jgi:uncharacterized metal-binding protein YceD (DUF177 family)
MKNSKNDYVITFKGLELGSHDFEFEAGDRFFEEKGAEDFRKGKVNVHVEMIKETTMLVLNFDLKGSVEVACDRCLEKYDQQLEGKFRLIVKFGEEIGEMSDELVVIPHEEYQLDLSQFIYEYIVLMLPIKHVHPDDENGHSTCNQDMIDRLENMTIKSDMRWDALKNIKLD